MLAWMLAALLAWQGAVLAQAPGELPRLVPACCPRLEVQKEPVAVPRPPAKKEQRQGRTRLYLSAALTLGAGALALWGGERADRAYRNYLRSASTRRQEKYFARAERYDRITGAAFAGMEVGLVLSAYWALFNR
jgi:hypothetical protein